MFEHLGADDRRIILSVVETLVGIGEDQLSFEQKKSLLIVLDQAIDSLNPDLQKDVMNIFTLFNTPIFRWYIGLSIAIGTKRIVKN